MIFLLFFEFLKIGFFGFGGGYAMIPLMEQAVRRHNWLTPEQYTDVIALASSAPGPIASNAAMFVGYETAGILGAVVAIIGSLLPSLFLMLVLIRLVSRNRNTRKLNNGLYGIHPVITALILYAGIQMGFQIKLFSFNASFGTQVGILLLTIVLMVKKISPLWIIVIAGITGIVIYGM
ncbi:chromate transporter [Pontibacillus salicampi]|uniref:Chromate transporter n=1 Tax=Pontibacillus salicampi TaxID=1449801 RepID=A0ABV6LU76_9BACI